MIVFETKSKLFYSSNSIINNKTILIFTFRPDFCTFSSKYVPNNQLSSWIVFDRDLSHARNTQLPHIPFLAPKEFNPKVTFITLQYKVQHFYDLFSVLDLFS